MDLVREYPRPSGKRVVRLFRRSDGFFAYIEEFEAFDEIAGWYWSSGFGSGIFESEDVAVAEIIATVPWLSGDA